MEDQDADWVDLMEVYIGVFETLKAGTPESNNDDIPLDEVNSISQAIMGG